MGMLGTGNALSADIVVFANQGAVSALRDLAPAYEKASGHKITVKLLEGPSVVAALKSDPPGDVASTFSEVFDQLVKDGLIVAGTAAQYARAGNGVAVKAGAPKPDISTVEGFKQAMLKAKSIGHSQNGTGPYNTKLFQRLGIYEQVKPKVVLSQGRPVATYVASGEVEIGIQQTNVIQPFPGTDYLGPLPAELMEYGHFSLGVSARSKNREAAMAFIAFATSPAAAPFIRKSTMEPPAR
jgi:molybdate transport system substrate-binding protein